MVVQHAVFGLGDENVIVSEFCRRFPDGFGERGIGVAFLVNVQVRVANHIEDDDGIWICLEGCGERAGAEKPIPVFDAAAVLCVKEDEPNILGFRREDACHFEKNGNPGRAVVGAGHPLEAFRWVWILVGVDSAVIMRAEEDARRRVAATSQEVVDGMSQHFALDFFYCPSGGGEFFPNPCSDFRVRGGPRRSRTHAALPRDIFPCAFAVETGGTRRRRASRGHVEEEDSRRKEEETAEKKKSFSMCHFSYRRLWALGTRCAENLESLLEENFHGLPRALCVCRAAFSFAEFFPLRFERREDAEVCFHGLKFADVGVGDVVTERAQHGDAGKGARRLALKEARGVASREEPGRDIPRVAFDAGELSGKEEVFAFSELEGGVQEARRGDEGVSVHFSVADEFRMF